MPPNPALCSAAAKRTWANPGIRAKRIAGIKAFRRANPGFKRLIVDPVHIGLTIETADYDAIWKLAQVRNSSITAIVRAYIVAGLEADKDKIK